MTKALKVFGAVFAVLVMAAVVIVHFFGPVGGALLLNKPIFLFNASEERINLTMLRIAGARGIYGDTEHYGYAYDSAKSSPSDRGRLEFAIGVAGGKHSKVFEQKTEQNQKSELPTVDVRDDVLWLKVPSVGRKEDVQKYANTLSDGIHSAQSPNGICAAVVDLRGNGGGDMGPMVAGLSPLLPDGTVLSFEGPSFSSDVTVSGNAVMGGGTPVETSGGKRALPVAVLVDGDTASSGEATMLAFRGLENSRSFGEPTAGYASANTVYDFPDGRSLMLTIAKDKARTGEVFNDEPIQPDASLAELNAWLKSQC